MEFLSATEKVRRIDHAKRKIAIGYSDLFAARVVTHRTRTRAGTARPNEQPAGFRLDVSDRATARADGFDIDDRLLHAKALDDRLLRVAPITFGDEPDIEARAAHIGGDHVFVVQKAGDIRGCDHPARRPRL